MNLNEYKLSKQDVVLLLVTLIVNFVLFMYIKLFVGVALPLFADFIFIPISLVMFFVYKKLNHQFWLKSYIVVLVSINVASPLTAWLPFPTYLLSILFSVVLVLTYKYCRHQYWFVLPVVFLYIPFGVSWILFRIQQGALTEAKNYFEHLNEMSMHMSVIDSFGLFVPFIASAITLFILKARENKKAK